MEEEEKKGREGIILCNGLKVKFVRHIKLSNAVARPQSKSPNLSKGHVTKHTHTQNNKNINVQKTLTKRRSTR